MMGDRKRVKLEIAFFTDCATDISVVDAETDLPALIKRKGRKVGALIVNKGEVGL